MFKSKLISLFIFLSFCWACVSAQDSEKYLKKLTGNSTYIYPTYSDEQLKGILLSDTLVLAYVKKAVTIQQIIKEGAANKVYAIEVKDVDKPELTKILAQLVKLPNLKYLKICTQGGPFDTTKFQLPGNIKSMQQLNSIEFYYPDKIDLSDALNKLSALKNLHTLIFTGYKYQLPKNITGITQLKTVRLFTSNIGKLDISNTKWQSVYVCEGYPESSLDQQSLLALSKISSLRNLDLEAVKLKDTTVLDKFTQLTTLRVYGQEFKVNELVDKIGRLTQLKKLALVFPNDNSFSIDGIKNLKNLTELTITRLYGDAQAPKNLELLAGFKKLEALYLNDCHLSAIPDVFDELPLLKTLVLSKNKLTELPNSVFNLSYLEHLNVSFNELTQLPPVNCFTCNNLKTLNVRRNGIKELPNAITRLSQLEYFYASENELISLPDGWQNLKKLKYFDATDNQLTAFPDGLQDNHSVETIDLSANEISYMPDVTGRGYALKELDLGPNPLMTLPEHIGRYTNLEVLATRNAKLTSIPLSLGNCKKLKRLVMENSFSRPVALPIGLGSAQNLSSLSLSNNPLLDANSVFNVILGVPRNHLTVYLHNNSISKLPATKKWATILFKDLDLSGNKLTTLPLEFADAHALYGIQLRDNPLPGNPMVYYTPVKTKEDMQVVFREMGMPLPMHYKTKSEHVIALINLAHSFYSQNNPSKTLDCVKQAIAIDAVTYNKNAHFDEIGICRFRLKDYKGAMLDFNKYIKQTEKSYKTDAIWGYKAQAYITLNQTDEAAKIFVNVFGGLDNCQSALILCKKNGNKILYNQLLDSALNGFKRQMEREITTDLYYKKEEVERNGHKYGVSFILNYACLFIMANRPVDAIEIMKKNVIDPFPQLNSACKDLLIAFANYLIEPTAFDKIKQTLQSNIDFEKKIPVCMYQTNLSNFSEWLPYSDFTAAQQQHLLELQNIAK
jgi:Leucine-rich repeat (LRR) protein